MRLGFGCFCVNNIVGGFSNSIFVETEKMLLDNKEYQFALKYVSSEKRINRYESMIDFLFCEIYSQHKKFCFRFYEGEGELLRNKITEEEIEGFDKVLVKVLEFAYRIYFNKRRITWKSFVEEVEMEIIQAS